MSAPAAPDIAAEFHIRSSVETVLTVSIFVLAYGTAQPSLTPNLRRFADASGTFSVWTTFVRPPFRNIRESTLAAVYKRPVSRWVERADTLWRTEAQYYSAFNLGCGFAQNKAQLTVLRFMAGLGGGAPLAVRISPPGN